MSLLKRSRLARLTPLAVASSWLWFACSSGPQQPVAASAGASGAAATPGSVEASGAAAIGLAGNTAIASAGGAANAGAANAGAANAGATAVDVGGAGAAQAGQAAGGASSAGQAGTAAGAGAGSAGHGSAGAPSKPALDVTFYVVADTHADPPPSNDLLPEARALNAVAQTGVWPTQVDGQDTHFKGGPIGKPKGVVFVGDLTGWGTAPTELLTFRHYFESGNSADSIQFPSFLGLGNHDLDSADRAEPLATQYRNQEWAYLDSRHLGANAPTPVTSFDAASHDYSFDFAGVHLVQLNRFVGDTQYGLASGLAFLAADLKKYASDGRPVILFQHYGMDTFGTEPRWWTDADRSAYRATLKGYHVTALIVGHTHAAFNYSWEGLRVFQVNNAKAEIGTGNDDGNGSFSIVRVTDQQLDVVTCRWLDDSGKYELIGPTLSGPTDPGAAQ